MKHPSNQTSSWTSGILVELLICFLQIGLALSDISQKFWLTLLIWTLFVVVGIRLISNSRSGRFQVFSSITLAALIVWFYIGLRRENQKEQAIASLMACIRSLDEKWVWLTTGFIAAVFCMALSALARRIFSRWQTSISQQLKQVDTVLVKGHEEEQDVPDDQVVPALLERLPEDQRILLLGLDLGEKVLALEEPGLDSLERNRLAQRLRLVEKNNYLFRLHPLNEARVRAYFHPGTRDEQPLAASLAYQGDINRLRELQPTWTKAVRYACEYVIADLLHQNGRLNAAEVLIIGLLQAYVVRPCEDALTAVDTEMSRPAPMSSLVESIKKLLSTYGVLVGYIQQAGPIILGEATFYASEGYAGAFRRHTALLEVLRSIGGRADFGSIAQDLHGLEQLLVKLPVDPSPNREDLGEDTLQT